MCCHYTTEVGCWFRTIYSVNPFEFCVFFVNISTVLSFISQHHVKSFCVTITVSISITITRYICVTITGVYLCHYHWGIFVSLSLGYKIRLGYICVTITGVYLCHYHWGIFVSLSLGYICVTITRVYLCHYHWGIFVSLSLALGYICVTITGVYLCHYHWGIFVSLSLFLSVSRYIYPGLCHFLFFLPYPFEAKFAFHSSIEIEEVAAQNQFEKY